MDRDLAARRASYLLDEVSPIAGHSDIEAFPLAYDPERDTLYLEIVPCPASRWAETAYRFAKQEGMKYDRHFLDNIDGQPRVSYSGTVLIRLAGDFVDGSMVAFHISSKQPSHRHAEKQLMRLYRLFLDNDGLEPIDVFRKYFMGEE